MNSVVLMLLALWIVGMGIWIEIGMLRRLLKKRYEIE